MKTSLCVVMLFLVGCIPEPSQERLSAQLEVKPELLCVKDGVKVWRVRDTLPGGNSFVYFTTPDGQVSQNDPPTNDD